MRELLPVLLDRLTAGPVALARVVATSGPAPRQLGAAMAVTAAGEVIGSLSAGCVDSAIVHAATDVLDTGCAVGERFGPADLDDIAIGLTCGGEIEIFVERIGPERVADLADLRASVGIGRPVALATTLTTRPLWRLDHPGATGSWRGLDKDIADLRDAGRCGIVGVDDTEAPRVCAADRPRTFVHTFAPPRRLIAVGANEFVRALCTVAKNVGYHVTVVDPRPVFTTPARFPDADEVVVAWPGRYLEDEMDSGRTDSATAVCVMTHDAKVDVPTLVSALASDRVGIIGALGSRATHDDRIARLTVAGVPRDRIDDRLRSPLGLDLGGHTPAEVAISIVAQLISERNGGTGQPLRDVEGPIHRRVPGS
ncbi:XdhC family protein [Gordonia insulae]|uniref:Putative xanthine dehydrogenase subunit A n=1 Tax=Gordonia insulae TaxID=2420509 RepID=A0A3G8JL25_9ACTN|nr:XdhC/CoxI family protein [Gordonia insulae]AZG45345.1 putative xanthine dehydrogenase subunit A [Gordonia insulae]